MVRPSLIIQVPDASNKWAVPLSFSPVNGFSLCAESAEHVIGMVFDDIIVYSTSLRTTLWTRFYINVSHAHLPPPGITAYLRAFRLSAARSLLLPPCGPPVKHCDPCLVFRLHHCDDLSYQYVVDRSRLAVGKLITALLDFRQMRPDTGMSH